MVGVHLGQAKDHLLAAAVATQVSPRISGTAFGHGGRPGGGRLRPGGKVWVHAPQAGLPRRIDGEMRAVPRSCASAPEQGQDGLTCGEAQRCWNMSIPALVSL